MMKGVEVMKVVILAGGFGTRLTEETILCPKPMIEIGGKPILWHIINICASFGLTEFIIALGYKGEMIKQYFLDFYAINNDISIDLSNGATTIHSNGIIQLLEDESLRIQISQQCRSVAVEECDLKLWVQRYIQLCNSLI